MTRLLHPQRLAAVVVCLGIWGCPLGRPVAGSPPVAGPNPADMVAQRMVHELGGLPAFQSLRRVSFDWTMRAMFIKFKSLHIDWDVAGGVARVVDGNTTAVLRLSDQQGQVSVSGKPLAPGPQATQHLKNAYASWVNASYWLAAPYKVLDEGAVRALEADGRLRISFAPQVGLTAGDVYHFTLDNQARPVSWAVHTENGMRFTAVLEDPVVHHGVTLFQTRRMGPFRVTFDDLAVSREPDPTLVVAPSAATDPNAAPEAATQPAPETAPASTPQP